jgi:hypothetical protein
MVRIQPINAGQGLDIGGVPDTSRDLSIARGIEQVGSAIGHVGQVMGEHELRLTAQRRQVKEFTWEQKFERQRVHQAADYDQRKARMDASGLGFADSIADAYAEEWESWLEQVPPELQPRFRELVRTDIEGRILQAATDEVEQRGRFFDAGVADAVNAAQTDVANRPDLFDQRLTDVFRVVDATNWPPSKKAGEKRKAQEMLGRACGVVAYLARDPRAARLLGVGEGAMAAPEVAMLSPSERVGLYEQAQMATRQRQAATAAADKETSDQLVLSLRSGIDAGTTSRSMILDAPIDHLMRVALLQEQLDKEVRDQRSDEILASWRNGTATPVNSFDPNQSRELNRAFERLIATAPDDVAASTLDFIETFQFVPDRVVANVRQGLSSTDVPSVTAALEQAAVLYDTARIGLSNADYGDDVIRAALTYDHYINDLSRSKEWAAAEVIRLADPQYKIDADLLQRQWAGDFGQFSIRDVVAAFDDMWFGEPRTGIDPEQERAIMADFLDFAWREYVIHKGDVGLAKKLALQSMKDLYGVSRISNEPMIMRVPPERAYPAIDGGWDYLQALALKDARTIDPRAQEVLLLPPVTDETIKDYQAGRPAHYELWFRGTSGEWKLAEKLFLVEADEIKDLQNIAEERRRIRGAITSAHTRTQREFMSTAHPAEVLEKVFFTTGRHAVFYMPPEMITPELESYRASLASLEAQWRSRLGLDELPADPLTSSNH